MITEDYVSFDTAKLLKEKGFDEKCRYVYNTEGKKIASEHFMEGESFVDKIDIESVARYDGWNTYLLGDYAYLCPTLQMAMKWLREVHKIAINIEWGEVFEENYQWWCIILNQNSGEILRESEYCKTYEEAAEEAIKYCLENLI